MTDARNYRRIPFRTHAELLIDGVSYSCELVDIALRGALLKTSQLLPLLPDQQLELRITLPDSDLVLTFGAELVHQGDGVYGFLFASEDIETLAHLRRLLELNFGDAELAEQEFAHWLHKDGSH